MVSLNNDFNVDELKDFIFKWNIDFPIDRWWRKRHGVIFNSSIHREVSFVDMFIEFLEEDLYEEFEEKRLKLEEDPYIPGQGNFLFKREDAQELTDQEFSDIDLDSLP